MKINYLDLFSGIGGFAEGLRQAGFEYERHWFSEIDKYAIEIYQRHFPEAIPIGDVTKIQVSQQGNRDNIVGEFIQKSKSSRERNDSFNQGKLQKCISNSTRKVSG